MNRFSIVPPLLLFAFGSPSIANPIAYRLPGENAEFAPGPGVESARSSCGACHSADYISTQPSRKGKAFWQAEEQKMIKVFKAPIAESDIPAIVDYLAATY